MEYRTKNLGMITVLYLKDNLSFRDTEDLGNLLHQIIHDTDGDLVIDFSEVGQADHTIPGQFVAAFREAKVKRREVVFSSVSPSVRRTFGTGQLEHLIKIYDNSEQAIAYFAEKHYGKGTRNLVADIECGHDDCAYYTYINSGDGVVPACQYPYPEDITNGPNCRCYRLNWNQLKWTSPDISSPFHPDKKKSPYNVPQSVQGQANNEAMDTHEEEDFEAVFSSTATEENEVANSQNDDLPDPFAEDNFPSSKSAETTPDTDLNSQSNLQQPTVAMISPPATDQDIPPTEPAPEQPRPHSENILDAGEVKIERRMKPEEIAGSYVTAWNDSNFALEYRCLSVKNRVLPIDEYCQRRESVKQSQVMRHGKATVQEVVRVDGAVIQDGKAYVEITRVDRTPLGTTCYAQFFTLEEEDKQWRIISSRNGEERKNPIKPPTDRKMKATDFLNRDRREYKSIE